MNSQFFLSIHYEFNFFLANSLKIVHLNNRDIFWAPGASCGRFSIGNSRFMIFISTRWSNGVYKWPIMTHFSLTRNQYNHSSLLSHENNFRHADGGARKISAFEVLIIFIMAAEINKKWNVIEVKTDKKCYHHRILHTRIS